MNYYKRKKREMREIYSNKSKEDVFKNNSIVDNECEELFKDTNETKIGILSLFHTTNQPMRKERPPHLSEITGSSSLRMITTKSQLEDMERKIKINRNDILGRINYQYHSRPTDENPQLGNMVVRYLPMTKSYDFNSKLHQDGDIGFVMNFYIHGRTGTSCREVHSLPFEMWKDMSTEQQSLMV